MTPDHGLFPRAAGFSLVELLVALAVSLLVTSAAFAMLDPANGAFRTQPESADVAQRLRAASDALLRDLEGAGSAPIFASGAPIALQWAASVFPYRIGRRSPDPPGTFEPARVAVWDVRPSAPQATVASPLPSASGVVTIAPGAGCPPADQSCGLKAGALVAAFSHSGIVDLFSVASVNGSTLMLQHNQADSSRVYPAGSTVLAEVTARTYFLRSDSVLGYSQLRRYDGAGGADVPVADHIAAVRFEYYGAAEAPHVVPGSAPPRVTYGPPPPDPGVQLTAYPPGENCAFARTPGGAVASRLAALASDPVLVPLPASMLTDGPWCPDDLSPIRYDADLLRIRQVVVTITTESAIDALRGPAGPWFTRAGTAHGTRWVPDREARLAITPGALNAAR